jgi:uncharacterized protein with NRDE domain
MCVVYFAYNVREDFPLVLLANRDEYYERPTLPAARWEDHPSVFAGRDLVAGGTWLGIADNGRVAAVTNYREPGAPKGTRSRGDLVADFLKGDFPAGDYLAGIAERPNEYSGFNLIVGDFTPHNGQLLYYSNRGDGIRSLEPGIYGLSNHLLDTPWPKVRTGLERFGQFVSLPELEREAFFDLLSDEAIAPDDELPDTGVGYEIERALSSIFIRTPGYGTRCSTVVTFDRTGEGELEERVFV